jgi:hypothetical protein
MANADVRISEEAPKIYEDMLARLVDARLPFLVAGTFALERIHRHRSSYKRFGYFLPRE